MKKNLLRPFLLCIFGYVVSCGPSNPEVRHVSVETTAPPLPRAMEELRSRQLMRFRINDQWYEDQLSFDVDRDWGRLGADGTVSSSDEFQSSIFFRPECERRLAEARGQSGTHECLPMDNGGTCGAHACYEELAVCQANLFLEVSNALEEKVYHQYGSDIITIPVQSAETKAALAELALYVIGNAFRDDIEYFAVGAREDPEGVITPCAEFYGSANLRAGEALFAYAKELFDLSLAASSIAADKYASLSDAERSRNGGLNETVDAASVLRQHAAHILSGGAYFNQPGLEMCSSPELSAGARDALSIIRQSGISPDVLTSTDPMSGSMASLLSVGQASSVADRYARRTAQVARFDGMTAGQFLSEVGLTLRDFEDARLALSEELKTFSRSSTDVLNGESVPGYSCVDGTPGMPDGCIYVATATEPSARHWSFREGATHVGTYFTRTALTPYTDQTFTFALPSIYMLANDFATGVEEAMSSLGGPFAAGMAPLQQFRAAIDLSWSGVATSYSIMPTITASAPGSMVCPPLSEEPTEQRVVVAIRDAVSASSLLLLRSKEATECAATGSIDGQACQSPDLGRFDGGLVALSTLQGSAADFDELMGPPGKPFTAPTDLASVEFSSLELRMGPRRIAAKWGVPVGQTETYLARLRPGASPLVPGSYEIVGMIPVVQEIPDPGTYMNRYTRDPGCVHIVPRVQVLDQHSAQRAGELLAPSTSWCAQHETSCADGLSDSSSIPLEDAVTEGGSDFEDSWRHYLAQARILADRADAIGSSVLDSQFLADERTEASIDRITDICGVDVPLSSLASLAASESTKTAAELVEMLSTSGTRAEQQQGSQLLQCVGGSIGDAVPYAVLGTRPICLWRSDTTNALCEPADSANPERGCPYVIDNPAACDPAPSGATLVSSSEIRTLGVITPMKGEPLLETSAEGCEALLRLRAAGATPGDMAAYSRDFYEVFGVVPQDGPFGANNLSRIAPLIRFVAEPGLNARLEAGTQTVLSTGSDLAPTSNPPLGCSTGSVPASCSSRVEGSLLCDYRSCASDSDRLGITQRMFRAAVRARVFAQSDLLGFVVPVPRNTNGTRSPTLLQRPAGGFLQYYDSRQIAYSDERPSGNYYCTPTPGVNWIYRSVVNPLVTRSAGLCNEPEIIDYYDIKVDRPYGNQPLQESITTSRRKAYEWIATHHTDPLTFLSGIGVPLDVENVGDLPLNSRTPDVNWEYSANAADVSPGGFIFDNFSPPEPRDYAQYVALNSLLRAAPRATNQEYWDAMELFCAAARPVDPAALDVPSQPTAADMPAIARVIEAGAGQLNARAEAIVFEQLPTIVVDAIATGSGVVSGTRSGELQVQVEKMSQAVIALRRIPAALASEVGAIGRDIRTVDIAIQRSDLRRVVVDAGYDSAVAEQAARCANAIIHGSTGWVKLDFAASAAAAVTCASSIVQIRAATERAQAERQITDLDLQDALVRFGTSASGHADRIFALNAQLNESNRDLQAALASIQTLRAEARRELARALYLNDPATGAIFSVDAGLRSRMSMERQRYEAAKRDAIRGAWMARRAIEQRFGTRLASITENLSRVEAPAQWESTLCTMEGFDFRRIRNGTAPSLEGKPSPYIGDYVTKLELFVESYSSDFPFQEGSDVAVISLRDDVMNARAVCDRSVENAFHHSANLSVRASGSGVGWNLRGCRSDSSGVAYGNCMTVSALAPTANAMMLSTGTTGTPQPFRLVYGPVHPDCAPGAPGPCPCTGPSSTCGYQSGVSYGQDAHVSSGLYRLSWYARDPSEPESTASEVAAVTVEGLTSASDYPAVGVTTASSEAANGWVRRWFLFESPIEETVRLSIRPVVQGEDASIEVGGFMLERLGAVGLFVDGESPPRPFAETGEQLTHPMAVCEDTTGETFRETGWRRSCERLCPTGWGTSCAPQARVETCFWETSVTISNRAIESGAMLSRSGFALGNFNYRADTLALNFVGSGARTCQDDSLPSTCYNAGFIQYSIEHQGPYEIRNHRGDIYEAPLFYGRIVNAKGLATERYLTNPIGSSDLALISQFEQTQLRGRPITGTYRIRVNEGPGVNWEGVEDIQMVLRYRFWTRND